MNAAELAQIAVILSSLISIPFVAKYINVENDYKSAISLINNDTKDFSGFYEVKREIGENGIIYTYKTHNGVYTVKISSDGVYSELTRIGRKVSVKSNFSHEIWILQSPGVYLRKIRSFDGIETIFKTPEGIMKIKITPSGNHTKFSGFILESEMKPKLEKSEEILRSEVYNLKNFTEDILGIRKVEITYLKCSGGNESEYVEITNKRMIPMNLEGWKLYDTKGNTNVFVLNFTLSPGESVKLFRNRTGIIWSNDDKAVLENLNGRVISERECDE